MLLFEPKMHCNWAYTVLITQVSLTMFGSITLDNIHYPTVYNIQVRQTTLISKVKC